MAENDVIGFLIEHLPPDASLKANGEYVFNCRTCYRTERPDTRRRGGLKITGNGFLYHCFNCKFSCGYTVGNYVSRKVREFITDLCGAEVYREFYKLAMDALNTDLKQSQDEEEKEEPRIYRQIPSSYIPIRKCLEDGITNDKIERTLNYIANRNVKLLDWADLYICPNMGEAHFLIPCYENEKVVGYSLRYASDYVDARYLHYVPRGHIFNSDTFNLPRKYHLLCEGQLDALALNCASILGNELKKTQTRWIKILANTHNFVFLPDKDKAGSKIIDQILTEKLPISVSFPNWSVKDGFEAAKQYGRIKAVELALENIVSYRDETSLRIVASQWN